MEPARFGPAPWGVTTVSRASADFDPRNYWRGPVWINVNWIMIRGLERYGLDDEAERLRRLTLDLVSRSGFSEYYEPDDGRAAREQRVLLERLPHPRPAARSTVSYDPEPTYPLREGAVDVGYEALAEDGARDGVKVIAVDGASTVAWDRAAAGLRSAFTPARRRRRDRRHATSCAAVGRGRAPDDRPGARRRPRLRADPGQSASASCSASCRTRAPAGRSRWSSGRGRRSSRTICCGGSICRRPTAWPRCSAARHRTSASRRVRSGPRSGSCSSTGLCSTGTSGRTRTGSTVSSTSPTRPCRARSPATACGRRSPGSPVGRSGRVRRSSPAPGAASGFERRSASRRTRRTSPGRTS